jgi:hypothetical protein
VEGEARPGISNRSAIGSSAAAGLAAISAMVANRNPFRNISHPQGFREITEGSKFVD